jgi:hypothetical protein
MANCAQATMRGSTMVVECDDRWDCCQRAQAKAKVARMKKAMLELTDPRVRAPGFSRAKGDDWCKSQRKQMDNKSPADQAQAARDAGAPECLAKQLEGDPANGVAPKSRADLDLALDHPLDMKLGGPAMPQHLMPLDPKVNGAFGSFARVCGDKLGTGKKLGDVQLVCPPSGNCPGEDHSTTTAPGPMWHEWSTTYAFT